MTYKRYKPDPSELAHAAALSQSLASANHNATQLSAALTRIAGRLRSGADGPARSAAQCGPGG